jgi:hypothetical protein
LGFAILGQKQYPSALVRYLALARAEVFQFSPYIVQGFLSSSSVFKPVRRYAGWAAVQGGRFSNSTTTQNPIMGGHCKNTAYENIL